MRSVILLPAFLATALAQTQYTSTGTAAVAKARATALTESPTSNIAGKTFDRFVAICKFLVERALVFVQIEYKILGKEDHPRVFNISCFWAILARYLNIMKVWGMRF
jgi:hypothetical protein